MQDQQFIEFVVTNQHRIYRFILSLTGDYRESEDLLQQTMLTLWQKWDQRQQALDDCLKRLTNAEHGLVDAF